MHLALEFLQNPKRKNDHGSGIKLLYDSNKLWYYFFNTKGLILYLIFPVIVLVLVLVLVIVLLQCLPSSSVQSYRINIAKAL